MRSQSAYLCFWIKSGEYLEESGDACYIDCLRETLGTTYALSGSKSQRMSDLHS